MQKTSLLKNWKKIGGKHLKSESSNYSSNNIFSRFSRMYSFSLYTISFVGKILEHEKLEVKVRTLTFAWAGPVPGPKAIGQ